MSKFNKKSQGIVPNSRNVAGGESFKREDVRQEIVTLLLNSMLAGNSFYEKEKSRIDRIIEMVRTNAEYGEFLSKAMVYARNDGNLRSVSHVVATALVENIKGVNYFFLNFEYENEIIIDKNLILEDFNELYKIEEEKPKE